MPENWWEDYPVATPAAQARAGAADTPPPRQGAPQAPIVAGPGDILPADIEAARTGRQAPTGGPLELYVGPGAARSAAEDRIARERAKGLAPSYSVHSDTGELRLHIGGQTFRPAQQQREEIQASGISPQGVTTPPPDVSPEEQTQRFFDRQAGPNALRPPGPIDPTTGEEVTFDRTPGQTPSWVPEDIRQRIDVQRVLDHPGQAALATGQGLLTAAGMPGTAPGSVAGPVSRVLAPVTQPVETAASKALGAVAAYPKTTGAGIGAGAIAATTGEAGDDPRAKEAAEQDAADRQGIKEAQQQLAQTLAQRKSLDAQRVAAVQARDDQGGAKAAWFTPQGNLKVGPNSSPSDIKALQTYLQGSNDYKGPIDGVWKGGTATAAQSYAERSREDYKAKDAEVTRLGTEMGRLDKTIEDLRRRSSPEYAVFVGRIREAERVRQQILDKAANRAPFEQDYPGAAKHWWIAPIAAGFVTALALRFPGLVKAIGERGQAGRWREAVERATNTKLPPAQRNLARLQAEKFESSIPKKVKDSLWQEYKWPLIIGAGEGAGLSNTPEIHDLFLPHDNPERIAYEAYLKHLPIGADEIQRTIELLKHMPEDNPMRRAALDHFAKIYPAVVRAVEGMIEGAGGAAAGTTLGGLPAKAIAPTEASLPRPETKALKGMQLPPPRAKRGPKPLPPPPPVPLIPAPAGQQGGAQAGGAGAKPPPALPAPPRETWQAPDGSIIKRGATGKTWHKGGKISKPPPPGSKRLSSLLDRIAAWGGYA